MTAENIAARYIQMRRKRTRILDLHLQGFEFVFTPKHGSWLNLVETMFRKMARTMLRGIRVVSKQELIDRIHLYFAQVNSEPVIFRWKYKFGRNQYCLAINRMIV
jgi:transposase